MIKLRDLKSRISMAGPDAKEYLEKLESLREWADLAIFDMECRGDENCDHCEGMRRLRAFGEHDER